MEVWDGRGGGGWGGVSKSPVPCHHQDGICG